MSHTSFRGNLHSIGWLNVKELLARNMRDIWSLSDCHGTSTHNHLVPIIPLVPIIWPNWPNDWTVLWVLICMVHLNVCCSHFSYYLLAFHSPNFTASQFFPLFILIIWSCNVIYLKFWKSLNSFNLIFLVPRHVTGMFRCEHVHPLSRLDVYICPIKITLSGNRLRYTCHCSMV